MKITEAEQGFSFLTEEEMECSYVPAKRMITVMSEPRKGVVHRIPMLQKIVKNT